ncbi:MAG TPA: trypsin-like serine protease [Oligoflexus sp.]|uniref:S1 family peptidase n=1 Tax=Oligoflexus sp. TaxID=1971216 RepID=UPI002D41CBEE|nr:trypsin-like serine protease [Oligoflexus sp.]HYX34729.1 trypsin-like serine protease [Oligoflexus sp.]
MPFARHLAPCLFVCSLSLGCGSLPSPDASTSIYQGTITKDHESVGLLIRDGKLWCSATLIAPQLALSAGHCFEGKSETPASLFIDFNQGAIRTQVSEVIVHPQYSDWFGRVTSDFALLKLAEKPGLPSMKLAASAPIKGEPVLFVGYGYTDSLAKDTFDGTKRMGTNKVGTVDAKKLFFPKPTDATTSQVCRGDSGGPVFATRSGGLELIGIVSGSTEGAAAKTCRIEAYAARVDAYLEWIRITAGLPL